ncbi:Thioredoxin domain-containing protein 17, partial [Lunasporangiospora selenospora]
MPAVIVPVPAIEVLHSVVNQTVEEHKGKEIFVYYYASIDPATGKSWCPDCVQAGPIIYDHFAKLDNAVLVDVPVGDRPTWKDPNHIFRHDPIATIKAVPTLVHWAT